MFLKTRTSRRRRALVVAVLGFVLVAAAIQRGAPSTGFYDWIEPHPTICCVVRPFFVLVGKGAEFDTEIQSAMLYRILSQIDPPVSHGILIGSSIGPTLTTP